MDIYLFDEREVHMFGEYVGVCWNTRIAKEVKREGDTIHKIEKQIRQGDPYIDFVYVRDNGHGAYEDEDSSVAGGLTFNQAKMLIRELEEATAYMYGIMHRSKL